MNDKNLKLLYRYFDEKLTPAEQKQLEEALQHSKELQKEKNRLSSLRKLVATNSQQTFKPFFADRVMRRISQSSEKENRQEMFFDSLLSIFRPIAIGATVVLILIMSYNIIKTDQVSLAGALATPEVTLEEAIDPTLLIALELEK